MNWEADAGHLSVAWSRGEGAYMPGEAVMFVFRTPTVPKFVPTSNPDKLPAIAMLSGVSALSIATCRNLLPPRRKSYNSFVC